MPERFLNRFGDRKEGTERERQREKEREREREREGRDLSCRLWRGASKIGLRERDSEGKGE